MFYDKKIVTTRLFHYPELIEAKIVSGFLLSLPSIMIITMRKLLLFLLILVVVSSAKAKTADSVLTKKIDAIIGDVKKIHAPDKRTALFNVQADENNPSKLTIETTEPEALENLKALFAKAKIDVEITPQLLPSPDLGDKIYGVANLSVCNNRTTPGNAAEMATQMLLGTPVEILKKERGYFLVRTPDRYISWTDDSGVGLMDENEFNAWKLAEKIVYTADYGHSYQQPSKISLRVSDLVKGNILQLLGIEKGFYKVAYPDKRVAYIPDNEAGEYNKWISRPNPTANQILTTARTLIGVPYLWGGTSVKGVDCSGFTKTSYFLNGIIIPRDASQQALVGEKVDIFDNDTVSIEKSLKNLKPGDLLFFAGGKSKSPNPRVTHTAIYIGEGQFIQSAGMVRINSMLPGSENYDDFQSRSLVGARRILTSIGKPEITRVDNSGFYSTKSAR